MKKRLNRKFYNRSTLKVARELLGKYLVVKKGRSYVSGKIVETEAYIGRNDPASHAFRGMTPRNKVMFGDPGYAYVYLTYGMHHCLNFVTERKGFPAAVLIRALEPAEGIKVMRRRRKTQELKNLTNGPGKLCQALGIDRTLNGADLCSDRIYVEDRGLNRTVQARGNKPTKIATSSRIGILQIPPFDRLRVVSEVEPPKAGNEGKDKKWRFYIEDNEFVSK